MKVGNFDTEEYTKEMFTPEELAELKEWHRKNDQQHKERRDEILKERIANLKAVIVKSVSFDPDKGKWFYQIFNMSQPTRTENYMLVWESRNWFDNKWYDSEEEAKASAQKHFEFYLLTSWDQHKLGEE